MTGPRRCESCRKWDPMPPNRPSIRFSVKDGQMLCKECRAELRRTKK